MKKIIILFLSTLFIVSCSSRRDNREVDCTVRTLSNISLDRPSHPVVEKSGSGEVIKKKIIKDGKLSIRVDDLNMAKQAVDTLVRRLGGYYDNEHLSNNDNSTEYDLTIRVPAEKFGMLYSQIEKGGSEVVSKQIDARDVTEEYYDLETRLVNKRKYLKRYQELLGNAKNVKEILEIEEKIRVLEEEIDSTTGRLKYLSDQVSYSTIELNLSQPKEFVYSPERRERFFEKFKQSISVGWYGFQDFVLFFISNWAVLILLIVLVYIMNVYRKKRKIRKQNMKSGLQDS